MTIYEMARERIIPLDETTFGLEGLTERGDLQRLLRDCIGVVAPDALVLTEEFGRWEDSQRRIDLLCVDRDANLVVIELKRGQTGGHMELQALRYAAMVSTMTFEQAADAHEAYLRARGGDDSDSDGAAQAILDFLGWNEPDEDAFGQDVRIVLVAGDFSRELTTAVLWLNERDVDIRCVRLRPYSLDGRVLMDVQQVIPLPEAAEYQVRVREKARKERIGRKGERDQTKFDVTVNGETFERLPKRRAAFAVIQGLCTAGVLPDQITDAAGSKESRLWRSAPGELDEARFAEHLRNEEEHGGGRFDQNRWYCGDADLIHAAGRTWAVTNQWGQSMPERIRKLLDAFPDRGVTAEPNEGSGPAVPWNGRDFYISFGANEHRSWDDARRYGFISGGGGKWYSQTLAHLKPGHRVFVNIPKSGFVGIGEVLATVVPLREFEVEVKGRRVPFADAPINGKYHRSNLDDDETCEHLVSVKWLKTVTKEEAIWEPGLFAIQHTACRLRRPLTIETVSRRLGIDG